MQRVWYILKNLFRLIGTRRLFFLAPIFIALALIAFLVYYVGPAIIVSFLYAGV
jgi:hypothetical protein